MIDYYISKVSKKELKKEYPYLEIYSKRNNEFVPDWNKMDAEKDFEEVKESDLIKNLLRLDFRN